MLSYLLCSLGAIGPAQAALYKCTDATGEVSYQQTACTGDAHGDSLQLPQTTRGRAQAGSKTGAQVEQTDSSAQHWSVEQQLKRMRAPAAGEPTKAPKTATAKDRAEPPARPRRVQILNAIRRHQVIPGMTPNEVDAALGPPAASKRDSSGLRRWSYRGTDAEGNRRGQTVYFRDDRVTGVSASGALKPDRFDPDQDRWLE